MPYIASSRTSTGGMTGHVPVPAGDLEGVADERELEQRALALEVGEPGARGPRPAARSSASADSISSTWSRGAKSKRGRSPKVRSTIPSPSCPSGACGVGQVRHRGEGRPVLGLGLGELPSRGRRRRPSARSARSISAWRSSAEAFPIDVDASFWSARARSTSAVRDRRRSSRSTSASTRARSKPRRASAAATVSGSERSRRGSIMPVRGNPRSAGTPLAEPVGSVAVGGVVGGDRVGLGRSRAPRSGGRNRAP